MLTKNFVEFFRPGFVFSEVETKPIDSWDVDKAIKILKENNMKNVYGFWFITKGRNDDELDSYIVKCSGVYYLGGVVKSLKDIKAEHDPRNRVLINNMEDNNWDYVIRINGGTYPFNPDENMVIREIL